MVYLVDSSPGRRGEPHLRRQRHRRPSLRLRSRARPAQPPSSRTCAWPRRAMLCPRCGKGHYQAFRGIEVGQVFKLGTKYSKSMNCVYLDEHGKENPMVMGCYGIGITRTVAAAIEQNYDADGIIWPWPIAPYQVHLLDLDPANAAGARGGRPGGAGAGGRRLRGAARRPGGPEPRRQVQGRRPAGLPPAAHGRLQGPQGRRGGTARPAHQGGREAPARGRRGRGRRRPGPHHGRSWKPSGGGSGWRRARST